MSFKSVVVLGGGPIGLMCAIEAKQNFVKKVTIVEKRQAYTRTNVPQLQNEIVKHLKDLGLKDTLWAGRQAGDSVAFFRIEKALWDKAQQIGVRMERGYVIEGLIGRDPRPDGFYKSMTLVLKEWDDKAKASPKYGKGKTLDCDLLVVASGGGAASDPVLQKLGFTFEKLKAKNYGAFGIFNPDPPGGSQTDLALKTQVAGITKSIVPQSGKIGFSTPDHNYLLVTLAGCTKSDFKYLQANSEKLKELLLAVGKTVGTAVLNEIKQVQKNLAVFKIAVVRAKQFYSDKYPAVILGDAAVTPHPEAGSGIGTGFKGFQELQKLFQALKHTHRSEDNTALFLKFNESYELHVSQKALEGTIIILRNLTNMLETFKADVEKFHQAAKGKALKKMAEDFKGIIQGLIGEMAEEKGKAEGFRNMLNGDNNKPELNWDANVGKLWQQISLTYAQVKQLTADISLLDSRLKEIESKIQFA